MNDFGCTSGTIELDTTFLPGGEDAADVLRRLERAQVGGGGVADAIGVEREDGVDVVASRARRPAAAPHSSPASWPALAALCTHTPGELDLGMLDDAAQREEPDVAGAPLDDSIRHSLTSPSTAAGASP